MTLNEQSLTMAELMDIAVATEKHGAELYQTLARRFSDVPAIADVFRTLSADESSHRDQFAAMRSRVQRMQTTPSKQRAMELQARALEEFFGSGVRDKIDGLTEVDDALEMALNLEKSTLAFYESMQEALGNEPTLTALILAEKRHFEVVSRTMITGAEFRSIDDDFTGKQPDGAAKQDARLNPITYIANVR